MVQVQCQLKVIQHGIIRVWASTCVSPHSSVHRTCGKMNISRAFPVILYLFHWCPVNVSYSGLFPFFLKYWFWPTKPMPNPQFKKKKRPKLEKRLSGLEYSLLFQRIQVQSPAPIGSINSVSGVWHLLLAATGTVCTWCTGMNSGKPSIHIKRNTF